MIRIFSSSAFLAVLTAVLLSGCADTSSRRIEAASRPAAVEPPSSSVAAASGARVEQPASQARPEPQTGLDPMSAEIVRLTNLARKRNGVPPLRVSGYLNESAQFHADVMASQQCRAHSCPGEPQLQDRVWNTGYKFTTIGENIAWGWASPRDAVEWWLNSPGHRRNILNPGFTEIGIGMMPGGGGRFWVQNFGAPMSADMAAMMQTGTMTMHRMDGSAPPVAVNRPTPTPTPTPTLTPTAVPVPAAPQPSTNEGSVTRTRLPDDPGFPAPPAADSPDNARYFTDRVNEKRRQNGLSPLRSDRALDQVLQARAEYMARHHCSEKECPDGVWTTSKLKEAGIELRNVRAMFLWGPEEARTAFLALNPEILEDPRHNVVGIGYGTARGKGGKILRRWIVMTGVLH